MAPHIAIRVVWVLVVGWWLGPLMFLCGLLLTPTIVFTAPGYYLMDRAYTVGTLNLE